VVVRVGRKQRGGMQVDRPVAGRMSVFSECLAP